MCTTAKWKTIIFCISFLNWRTSQSIDVFQWKRDKFVRFFISYNNNNEKKIQTKRVSPFVFCVCAFWNCVCDESGESIIERATTSFIPKKLWRHDWPDKISTKPTISNQFSCYSIYCHLYWNCGRHNCRSNKIVFGTKRRYTSLIPFCVWFVFLFSVWLAAICW